MVFILWALGILFAAILFVGGYVFIKACVRRKELPWMVEEEIKKTGYAKYYNCIVASDAWLKAHNAQDVYVRCLLYLLYSVSVCAILKHAQVRDIPSHADARARKHRGIRAR